MDRASIPLANFATFGELLKFLRRRAQLSQLELSIAVGYSESQISRLETNQRFPDRASLLALFVPALGIANEPATIERLVNLAEAGRGASNAALTPAATAKDAQKPAGRLPVALSSFIGRRQELAELCGFLRQDGVRLLTLSGAAGCGKSRLALRVGEELAPGYVHGVWLTELAPISDPPLATKTIAATFDLTDSGDRPLLSRLIDFLRPRQLLLILDNCEHLLDAVAQIAATLLSNCPQLQVLTTSQETLAIPGEVVFRLQPLALPSLRRGERPSRAEVEGYDAIRLFVERASAAHRDFVFSDHNAPAIAQLCQRLDGIPLALELAAAWVDLLSPEQIAARLQADFTLLERAGRGILPRHQTLVAAIEWSYNLLSAEEQSLLRHLSIFVGGWTLDAVESVTKAPNALLLLRRLVDKSLVTAEHLPEGDTRYRLVDTIREDARRRLAAAGEEAEARDRHLAYFVALAEAADPELKSQQQMIWLTHLDQEQDNLRAALTWSQTPDRAGESLRLVAALGHYWEMRAHLVEGVGWCERALVTADDRADLANTDWRAKALFASGMLACYAWDTERSRTRLEESLRIYRERGDMAGVGATLCFLGIAQYRARQVQEAIDIFQEAIEASRRAEDAWWIAENLH